MMTNQTCASCLHSNKPSSDHPCDSCEEYCNWEYRREKSCNVCEHNTGEGFCMESCSGAELWKPKTNETKTKQQACRTCIHAAKSGHEEPCNDCHGTEHYELAEKPAYIHEVEIARYECPKCGKQYDTREKAEECYAHWLRMEKFKKCEPWRWYTLISGDGNVKWVFAEKVFQYEESSVWTRGSCRDTQFAIDDCFFNDRYSTAHWKISTVTLTLLEGYTQERLVPRVAVNNSRRNMPDSVREDIVRLIEVVKTEFRDRVLARPLTEIIETAIEDEFKKVWP